MLDGYVWTGKGSPTLEKRRERLAEWRAKPHRKVDRAFFYTIFNRDHPAFCEPLVAEAWADLELAMGDPRQRIGRTEENCGVGDACLRSGRPHGHRHQRD